MATLIECSLKKISRPDLPGGLRTEEVNGVTACGPVVNQRFTMMAKSLMDTTPGFVSTRLVETSRIVNLEEKNEQEWIAETESGSKYQIKLGDKVNESE